MTIGPLLIGFMASGWPFSWTRFMCGVFITEFLFGGCFYFFPYWMGRQKLNARIKTEPKYLRHLKLQITEEGIKGLGEQESLPWLGIVAADSNEEFTWLTYADKRMSIIPNRAFYSGSARLDFMGTVQHNIKKSRGMTNSNDFHVARAPIPPEKPLYILGLMCLIPIFGVLAGVVLVIIGLVKYKDKWFTLMGAAGIGVSVLMFMAGSAGLHFLEEKFFIADRGIFREIAQKDLNTLVKDVEFYKIQSGNYPQNLQQLSKDNDESLFIDPTQTRQKKHFFYYERHEGRYELFSCGEDGLPHTKDDIYPQITVGTVGKIGLTTYTVLADRGGRQ